MISPSPPPDPTRSAIAGWLRAFWREAIGVDWRERLRVVVLATLGIGITALPCHVFGAAASPAGPWLVAPLGAVLARYNRVLDISRDDLKALLEDTQL